MKIFKDPKWSETYSTSHEIANIKALNFARLYLVFTSMISIVLLQFVPNYSEAFKVFLNLIWYPGVNIGLTASGFTIGYDLYTKYEIKWKSWISNYKRYYLTYYFYAFLIIFIGIIGFAILQNTSNDLSSYIAPINPNNFLSNINYGWTNNPNNWYGLIFLYALIPSQNFYILGTIFVVTFFFFILVAPFIFNFMNKIKFSSCTAFVISLGILACFLSTWNSIFNANPYFIQVVPWFNYVNLFTNWIQILFMFIFGFYIRKYVKVIPWRKSLLMFISLALIFFAIETALDYQYQNLGSEFNTPNKFNVFYIGGGICSLPILILSFLFLNTVAQYKSNKEPSPLTHKINHFNQHHQTYISDQFMLAGPITRVGFGILFLKIILNKDISTNSNHSLIIGSSINQNGWGWYLILFTCLIIILIYGITHLKKQLFSMIEKNYLRLKDRKN